MRRTLTTIFSNFIYFQKNSSSLRFLSTKMSNSIINWPKIKKISGAIGTLTLIYSLNILPEFRQFKDPKHYYSNLGIRIQCSPLITFLSPKAGIFCNLKIPLFLREYIYGLYIYLYNCKMEEAKESSLLKYSTFSHFFNRELKEGIRPINLNSFLVSPADGTVLHFGKIENERIECVKGQDYNLNEFIGSNNNLNKIKKENDLYQLIIYLAPGDYHAFHSPTKWNIFDKIHFSGFYQSVRPSNFLKNPKLFCQNERIVLSGEWKFGYFSMTAVAAMFVGNIIIFNEEEKNRKIKEKTKFDKIIKKNPGEKIGEFRMGSAIVLIFEAPKNINFCIEAGQKLKYGEKLLL